MSFDNLDTCDETQIHYLEPNYKSSCIIQALKMHSAIVMLNSTNHKEDFMLFFDNKRPVMQIQDNQHDNIPAHKAHLVTEDMEAKKVPVLRSVQAYRLQPTSAQQHSIAYESHTISLEQ